MDWLCGHAHCCWGPVQVFERFARSRDCRVLENTIALSSFLGLYRRPFGRLFFFCRAFDGGMVARSLNVCALDKLPGIASEIFD